MVCSNLCACTSSALRSRPIAHDKATLLASALLRWKGGQAGMPSTGQGTRRVERIAATALEETSVACAEESAHLEHGWLALECGAGGSRRADASCRAPSLVLRAFSRFCLRRSLGLRLRGRNELNMRVQGYTPDTRDRDPIPVQPPQETQDSCLERPCIWPQVHRDATSQQLLLLSGAGTQSRMAAVM